MALNIEKHSDYANTLAQVTETRDAVMGEWRIKSKKYEYLKHPSQVDQTSPEQQARYDCYIHGAEFPGDTELTLNSMVGKMRLGNAVIKVPDPVAYLLEDSDGDGLPMTGAIEYVARDIPQAKFSIAVADYKGLTEVPQGAVSIADVEAANPRAVIKHYARESMANWAFGTRNGINQLIYAEFEEKGTKIDIETGKHEEVVPSLILALDEEGNYYQQKKTDNPDSGEATVGDPSYVSVNGQPLKFIPIAFIADSAMPTGSIPQEFGYLSPIAKLCIKRYQVSADYKETMEANKPTKTTSGWTDGDMDIFKEVNGGRDYIAVGGYAVNNLPRDVKMDISSPNADLGYFEKYFETAEKRTEKLGGVSVSDTRMTATEADIVAADQNSRLESIASNIEAGFERLISYCMMFEGKTDQDKVMDYGDTIKVTLPRDFAKPKLSVEEVKVMIELVDKGYWSKDTLMNRLKEGGWTEKDVDTLLKEIEGQEPQLDLPE